MPRGYPRMHLSRDQVLGELLSLHQSFVRNLNSGELSGSPAEILAAAIVEAYALGLDHGTDRDVDSPREVADYLFHNVEKLLKRRPKPRPTSPPQGAPPSATRVSRGSRAMQRALAQELRRALSPKGGTPPPALPRKAS